jgi:pimeloyl-ACP methyl ester carboxylesterase
MTETTHSDLRKHVFSPDGKTEYFFWETGSPTGAVLIFLPGFTALHSDFFSLKDHFDDNYRIIIPDLPGWGGVPKFGETMTLEQYAVYIKELLISLKVPKVVVLGHCMGGTLAIELAYQFPQLVERLILVSVPYKEGSLSREFLIALIRLAEISPEFMRPLFYFWRTRPIRLLVDVAVYKYKGWRRIWEMAIKDIARQPLEDRKVVEENWASLTLFDYRKAKHISIPTHVIYGKKDILIRDIYRKNFAQLFSEATLDLIEEAGHLPPTETPEELGKLTKKYLRG